MIFDAVENLTILHFEDARSNKLWGSFQYGANHYAFWCGVGQNPSFKNHGVWDWRFDKLTTQKCNKGYTEISVTQLLAMDTQFAQTFSDRFSWFVLSDTSK